MTTHAGDADPTIYLHIGTPKSGTTYLQSRFDANHEPASDQGLLWPGPRWGTHVEAVRDLRQLQPGESLDPEGPWMRLVATAKEWQGPRVLISMEWMAGCTSEQISEAVTSLQPNRIEIICTTRDLLRMFVAQWQEMTKNCRPWSWRQFVDEMVGDTPGAASRRFWTQQDVPAILARWAEFVPWDRFHLVTVPSQGSDPDVLWDRFCSVLHLDGSAFAQPQRNNESIGVVSASLMHRVNLVAISRGLDNVEYQRVLHRRLADEVLASRRGAEASIAVSPEVDAWVRRRAQRLVEDIGALGVDVVGDLTELLPGRALEGREPDDVSDTEMLDTCVEAIVELAMSQDAITRQLREENRALRKQVRRRARKATAAPSAGPRPVATTVRRRVRRVSRRMAGRALARVRELTRGQQPDDRT